MRYTVDFRGRVQGVFFRATTRDLAREFAVTGWVRNEPDGSVRLVAEGETDELNRFIDAIQRAKRGNIDETNIDKTTGTGEFQGFGVRY